MLWLSLWTLLDGFAKTEIQLIVFRAMQGLGAAGTVSSLPSRPRTREGTDSRRWVLPAGPIFGRHHLGIFHGQGEELCVEHFRRVRSDWVSGTRSRWRRV